MQATTTAQTAGPTRLALITGAARGIGRETARQLAAAGMQVIATSRRMEPLQGLANHAAIQARLLDVTDADAVAALVAELERGNVAVDVLVNSAGVFPDQGQSFAAVTESIIRADLEVHLFGAWRLIHALLPGMLARGYGRVVNLSSGYGAAGMGAGMTGYRIAKAAVNALTQIAAAECHGDVKVNAVDPGWVATEMGGPQAPTGVAAAAADVVHGATLPAGGPNGVLLRRRAVRPW